MRANLITVLACLGLVSAMPANREAMNDVAVKAVLKELEARGETVEGLVKRVDAKIYRDALPDCSKQENDPSYMIPKQTGYGVDQGVKIPKTGKDDACDNGYNGDDHCWTEYWLVESAIEFSGWQNSGAAIDCRTTSTCNSDASLSSQSCTSWSKSNGTGLDWTVLEGKLEYAIPETGAKVTFGSGIKRQWTKADTYGTTMCTTDSTNNRCSWNDQACHQVWHADRTKRIWGHVSRVCGGQTSAEVQQQTQNREGNWVRGQAEFSIALPVNQIVGCNAKCEDLTYNEPIPAYGVERVPFEVTFD